MTGYLRQYIEAYAAVAKPLQERKTVLLKSSPAAGGNARKTYSMRTLLREPNWKEITSFEQLQAMLSSPTILIYFMPDRILFIDLDALKERGFGAMIYYVKEGTDTSKYPPRTAVQPIMFLSRLLRGPELNYWPTELEIAGMVWVVRKVRHLIESSTKPVIIYIDYGANVGIAKQTSLTTAFTEKTNLCLIRASEFLQRYSMDVRYKPGKSHYVPDALLRLLIKTTPDSDESRSSIQNIPGELDILHVEYAFTASLVEMSPEFRTKILDGYTKDPAWTKVFSVLEGKDIKDTADAVQLFFVRADGLIYRVDYPTGNHAFAPQRLCLPASVLGEVFTISHAGAHPGFEKLYNTISQSFYIKGLSSLLKEFLRHCPECQLY